MINTLFKRIPFFLVVAISFSAWGAPPVGQIVDLVGKVWITALNQKPSVANFKNPIYMGDVLETKEDGAVKILFTDDTLLTLKENSKMLITEFLFQPQVKERKAVFNVLFGTVRTVVGKFFGKDQPVEIRTPNAVAGIRGTDVGALVKQLKKKKSLINHFSTFYCFDGLFEAFRPGRQGEAVQVTKGNAIEFVEDRISPVFPIPADVINNMLQIFDIPATSKSAVNEVTQKATTEEATANAAQPSTGQTSTASINALDSALSSEEAATHALTTTDPSTGILQNPGGTTQNTNTVPITITIPQ